MENTNKEDLRFTTKSIKKGKNKSVGGNDSSWFYVGLVSQIGFTISVPIVAGALLGAYIDNHWHTYPKASLALIVFGLVVSVYSFIKTIKEIITR